MSAFSQLEQEMGALKSTIHACQEVIFLAEARGLLKADAELTHKAKAAMATAQASLIRLTDLGANDVVWAKVSLLRKT
jgi:hypothetical protein